MTEPPTGKSWGVLAGMLALVFGAAILIHSCAPVRAHDPAHSELNGWFLSLHNKKAVPCCDGSDATRLSDVDWDSKDGHYRVRLEGEWIDVPDEAVIEGPNKSGPTMVWPYYINGHPVIRCFMPGSMT